MKKNFLKDLNKASAIAAASFAILVSIPSVTNAANINTQSNQVENKQLIAQSCRNTEIRLNNGQSQWWGKGSTWQTCNGYTLSFQNDGNLVLYNSSWRTLWGSNTVGRGYAFALQRDGNVVLYDNNWKPIWATNTVGNSGAFLALQTDGNLVVYNSSGRPLWATNTVQTVTNPNAVATPLASSYMKSVSQGFGGWNDTFQGFHTGYDIPTANENPSVYAIADGEVVWNATSLDRYETKYRKYWNGFLIVKHGTFYAYYGHLNSSLSKGSKVSKGSSIGTVRDAYYCNKSFFDKKSGECRTSSGSDKSILYRDSVIAQRRKIDKKAKADKLKK